MRHVLICAIAALCLLAPAAEAQQAVRPYSSAQVITPGADVSPGTGVVLACSAPGVVELIMSDRSLLDLYAQQGSAIIDNLSVRGVNAANTTATCIVSVLKAY